MIDWTPRKRPAARYQGHDIRRTGTEHLGYFKYRHHLECECGKVMTRTSGSKFDDSVHYSWTRHRRDLGLTT